MLRMAMDMIRRHPLLKNRREISKLSKIRNNFKVQLMILHLKRKIKLRISQRDLLQNKNKKEK